MPRKSKKTETPVVVMETGIPAEQPAKEVAVVNEEQPAVPAVGEAAVVIPENTDTTFELVIHQPAKDDKGEITYAVKFTLPNDVAGSVNHIIGTGLERFFSKMKACKIGGYKLIDHRRPVILTIKSGKTVIDFGKVEEFLQQTLKINNSDASMLRFLDRSVAYAADMLRPYTVTRVDNLRNDLSTSVQAVTGKQPKNLIDFSMRSIAHSEFVVKPDGQIAESVKPAEELVG